MLPLATHLIKTHGLFDSFYVVSLSSLQHKIDQWRRYFPTITPHYAVKCNPNTFMMQYLARQGVNFDCASRAEIEHVLSLQVNPSSIIFAHPCKRTYDLEYANKNKIALTTFDTRGEIEKIKCYAPTMSALLRLKIDNPNARTRLGEKYGARQDEYKALIDMARDHHLDIVGTCFHIGSATNDYAPFATGIEYAHKVLKYAEQRGFDLHTLDIGGGFNANTIDEAANIIAPAIRKYMPPTTRIIAEPGRFFAEAPFTLCVPIIGHRTRDDKHEYWIADGIYGSFNALLYDGQRPNFKPLRNPLLPSVKDDTLHDATIFGSACDSLDTLGTTKLPVLREGDYLMIDNFGAYTHAAAKNFNGIQVENLLMFYV